MGTMQRANPISNWAIMAQLNCF